MHPDLLQQRWWDASKLLLKGFIVGNFNVVLDLTGAPQLVVIKGENVMILHQQLASTFCLLLWPLVQAQQIQGSHHLLLTFFHI